MDWIFLLSPIKYVYNNNYYSLLVFINILIKIIFRCDICSYELRNNKIVFNTIQLLFNTLIFI